MSDQKREMPDGGDRIAKVMARAGVCSRREAERWIADGRVSVNGHRLASPAVTVTGADRITIDGKPLATPEPTRLWRYHKPKGLLVTRTDPQGRPTIFERLPPDLPRVLSVGRLDLNSEGLLLLTNDGAVERHLELPSTGWIRRYRVRVHGSLTDIHIQELGRGMTVDGIKYGPVEAVAERQQGANMWVSMALREGKNREIRTLLAALDLPVTRLIRTSYGPFHLGSLARGQVTEIKGRVLRQSLGAALTPP